jgi:hypothetical protein
LTATGAPLMNAWALNKDTAIKKLLLVLEERFGADRLTMSKQWDNDAKAVGLFRPGEEDSPAYIHTHGEAHGKYGVHLEYPGLTPPSTSSRDNLDLQHLIEVLAIHFNLVAGQQT